MDVPHDRNFLEARAAEELNFPQGYRRMWP
ncbi:hypothetical protein LCGC14_1854140, partial [marine sediment metagenome]